MMDLIRSHRGEHPAPAPYLIGAALGARANGVVRSLLG